MTASSEGGWQPPEPVVGPAPGFEFAGFGARLVAYIIDVVIVSIVVTVLVLVLGALVFASVAGANNNGLAAGTIVLAVVVIAVVTLGYFPWYWSRDGATPGMRMMGLRVVRDTDGGPLSGGQAILRLVGYWVSSFAMYLGFIWIFIDKRRRGWHDLIAGTVVIRRA